MKSQTVAEPKIEEVIDEKTSADVCSDLTDIMDEKEALLQEIKDKQTTKTEPDLEANNTDDTVKEEKDKPAKARTITREQLRALRLNPFDNLRTILICLLVVQYAMVGAISYHPDAFKLDLIAPRTYAAMTLFIATGRLLLVPLLFFVSGFASKFALSAHSTHIFQFLFKKTRRFIPSYLAFRRVIQLSKYLRGPVSKLGGTGSSVPYYASRAGRDALLYGPQYYIISLLFLDYIYALFWVANRLIFGARSRAHFINSPKRFKIWQYTFLIFIEGWIIFSASGLALSRLPESVHQCMYLSNSAELHFPFLYLIAYFAGIQFCSYYKFLLTTHKGNKLWSLIIRLMISAVGLIATYRHFPGTVQPYLDVRSQPPLTLINGNRSTNNLYFNSETVYGMWAAYTIFAVGEGVVQAFISTPILKRSWGGFSRYSFIQIYAQILFIGGSTWILPSYIDNILVQGLFTAFLSLLSGYTVQFIIYPGWIVDVYNAVFSHRIRLEDDNPNAV